MRTLTGSVKRTLFIIAGVLTAVLVVGFALTHINVSVGSSNVSAQTATCPDPDHEMVKGEYYQSNAGCSVAGDVQVGDTKDDLKPYYPENNTGSRGNVVTCTKNCLIYAPFGGADVSPRTADSLAGDELSGGCGSKCADVQLWTYPGQTKVKVVNVDTSKAGATPTATAPATTSTSASLDKCDPSLGKGEKMLVPVGCVVSGDVLTGPTENGPWHFEGKGVNTDGTIVVVKTAPIWVSAPYGASVTGASPDDIKATMMQVGCGFSSGCKTVTVVIK